MFDSNEELFLVMLRYKSAKFWMESMLNTDEKILPDFHNFYKEKLCEALGIEKKETHYAV